MRLCQGLDMIRLDSSKEISRENRSVYARLNTVDVGPCAVDLDRPPAQLVTTLALACPGVVDIRLWPLPVVKPWGESEERRHDRMP
jgi:hypothetical protein